MVYLLIWTLFGVAAAIAASNKGRSGCGWFLMGVLLGPFGLLFALLLQPVARPEGHGADSGWQRKCPYCAESIKSEATVCRFCGRDVPPDAAITAAVAAAAAATAAQQADIQRRVDMWERRWRKVMPKGWTRDRVGLALGSVPTPTLRPAAAQRGAALRASAMETSESKKPSAGWAS